MCKDIRFARRTAFAFPVSFAGSMTLEATILLPWFLFLVISLYSVIDMLCLQAKTTWYLHYIGNELNIYGQLLRQEQEPENLQDKMADIGISYLYIVERLEAFVDFPDKVWVTTSSLLSEGECEVVITYNYPIWPGHGILKDIWLQSKYYGLSWGAAETPGDGKVYIAENGEVYHLYADCSHILLTVTQLPKEQLQVISGAQGGTLLACSVCEDTGAEVVYITREKEKYHFSATCSSLKRTVAEKDLSWAMKRYKLCERCEERKEKRSE